MVSSLSCSLRCCALYAAGEIKPAVDDLLVLRKDVQRHDVTALGAVLKIVLLGKIGDVKCTLRTLKHQVYSCSRSLGIARVEIERSTTAPQLQQEYLLYHKCMIHGLSPEVPHYTVRTFCLMILIFDVQIVKPMCDASML